MSLSFTASLVPPPGFQDDPDAVSTYADQVQADDPAPIPVEGVEFEEFDMDTQPRRPVVPTERSYMFGGLETHRDHSAHALTAPMSELSVGDMSEDEESPPDSSARVSRLSWTSESSLAQDRAATEPPRSAAAQFSGAVSGSTESRIAREIRELKQRERELQRLRDKTGVSVDDYLSGYGSDEKESVNGETDSGNGGHLSPDSLPSLAETGRSRSQESVSSGHSSGGAGGGGRGANDKLLYRWTSSEQRGSPSNVTMSPSSSSGLSGTETPIQRDIRLASEREDERRRERETLTATSALALTSSRSAVLPSSRQIICQPEISTTSRPKIASPSSSSTSAGGALNNCARASSSTALPRVSSLPTAVDPQRGIMRRFIASRGRLRPPALINRSPGQRPVTQVTGQTPGGHVTRQQPAIGSCAPQLHSVARKQQARLSLPRQNTCLIEEQPIKETPTASMSIEDRIKQELVTMQRREEELRRHQLRVFALSQPDLLAAVEQQQEEQSMTSHDECQLMMTSHSPAGSLTSDSDVTSGGGQLYRTQSNPNLLNALMQGGMLGGGRRRRSELIDQWECRIQNTDP